MTYRVKNITIAVALALVAALLTIFYTTNYQRDVRKDETNVPVWVATRDIPAGTSGADAQQKSMLKKSEVVRRSVVPGAISNPDQVADLVTAQPIYAGEQVSTRRFSTPSQRGIQAQLVGVQRAIDIPGDKYQLLAGTVRVGDKVDLVATFGVGGSNGVPVTRIVLRDIEVLRAPGGGTGDSSKISADNGDLSVMLKVTDTQVQKLHWVFTAATKWHLELRPGTDAADSPENVESWYSVLREGVRQKQLGDAGVDGIPAVGEGNDNANYRQHPHLRHGLLRRSRPSARGPCDPSRPRFRRLERERRRGDGRSRRRAPPGRRARNPLDLVPRG
jgi:Flp pilus assembly protein CpaB